MEKITGIYKITSPSGRIYIGSSKNIRRRFYSYKNLHCKDQPKLYNSFVKYGVDNHIFEIECVCELSELYKLEREIGNKYNVLKLGLNCSLPTFGEQKQEFTLDVIKKLSDSKKGDKNPQFNKRGILSPNYGKERTLEHRKNLSKALVGRKGKTGSNHPLFGKDVSVETRNKIAIHSKRGKNNKAKKVINILTKQIFDCIVDAAEYENVSYSYLKGRLNGRVKNNTNYIFVDI